MEISCLLKSLPVTVDYYFLNILSVTISIFVWLFSRGPPSRSPEDRWGGGPGPSPMMVDPRAPPTAIDRGMPHSSLNHRGIDHRGGPSMGDHRGGQSGPDTRGLPPGIDSRGPPPGIDGRGPPLGMDPRGPPPGMDPRRDQRGPHPGLDPRGMASTSVIVVISLGGAVC